MSILNIWNHFLLIRLNFEKVDTKKGLLNFTVNHEKQISKAGFLSVEQHKKIRL